MPEPLASRKLAPSTGVIQEAPTEFAKNNTEGYRQV
jgi:hypothetical protein